jgi:DNA-binding transcriptional LysR family regulator
VIPPLPPRHAMALSYLPVAREPLVIAMSEEQSRELGSAADAPVDLRELAAAPLVVFPRRLAPGLYDMIMGCYGVAGLAPRIGQEAIQMQTIVSLVSAGMGVALVPESLRHLRRTGVVYRPLLGAGPSVETGLVWRSAEVSPVLAAFIDIVRLRPPMPSAL